MGQFTKVQMEPRTTKPQNLSLKTLRLSLWAVAELIYVTRQEMGARAASQASGAGPGEGQDLAEAWQ